MKNTLQSNANFMRWANLCNSFVLKTVYLSHFFVKFIGKIAKNPGVTGFLCNQIA